MAKGLKMLHLVPESSRNEVFAIRPSVSLAKKIVPLLTQIITDNT